MSNRATLSEARRAHFQMRLVLLFCGALLTLAFAVPASAIDFYEIQIYTIETTPEGHLQVELHSNTVNSARGHLAHEQLRPYEIHETLEATYGILPHLEIGQYFATAKLADGNYEYAGGRTKVHFGLGDAELWPLAFGVNFELDYMRRQAEENPLSFEIRPIVEKKIQKLWLVADLTVDKPFNGPGRKGFSFAPSGMVTYELLSWLRPGVEYYSDMGAIEKFPAAEKQQHFIVPTLNFGLVKNLELNLGIGFGLTRGSDGTFVKSIVGWTF